MKKRVLSLLIFMLISISFVSAYYGSYNSFSLSDLLESIDSSTMILGAMFIISFAVINFALVRAFRDNKATAGVVAFCISLFIVWGINKTGFDFESLFYGIGVSEGFLYTILPFILLGGIIFLGIKFGFRITLIVFGGLLIVVSFTDLIYSKGMPILIGGILILLGIFIPNFGKHLDYRKRLSEQKSEQKLEHNLRKQMLKDRYKLRGKYGYS